MATCCCSTLGPLPIGHLTCPPAPGATIVVPPPARLRPLAPGDGPSLYRLVVDGGGLDVNSPYAYVLASRVWATSSTIAEDDDGPLGFVLGVQPPAEPTTLFVWQVGVAPHARGRGLALEMLRHLVGELAAEHVEATVTPSNTASQRLFHALARDLDVPIDVRRWADSDELEGAEPEDLHRIGPIRV